MSETTRTDRLWSAIDTGGFEGVTNNEALLLSISEELERLNNSLEYLIVVLERSAG